MRSVATLATEVAVEVTTRAFRAGGGTTLYLTNSLQRCLRDINAAAQHLMVSDVAYENYGQFLLGLPDADPMDEAPAERLALPEWPGEQVRRTPSERGCKPALEALGVRGAPGGWRVGGAVHSPTKHPAEPGCGADCLQRPLLPRFRFRQRLSAGVRVCRDKPAWCEGVQVPTVKG